MSGEDLRRRLRRIDGIGYKAYRDIQGVYTFRTYTLFIDHVQADPFAAPSRIRIRVQKERALFPEDTYSTRSREIALRDFLSRRFSDAIQRYCRGHRGTGKSGIVSIDRPGQEILERSSLIISEDYFEARLSVSLPAFGRRVAARQAEALFFDEIPKIVDASLFFKNLDANALYAHIKVAEDADFLRDQLEGLGLIAFVADGALLPRASGIDPPPPPKTKGTPFLFPPSLPGSEGTPPESQPPFKSVTPFLF